MTNPFLSFEGRAYSIVGALLGSQARGLKSVGGQRCQHSCDGPVAGVASIIHYVQWLGRKA